jgi:hypothetical protein
VAEAVSVPDAVQNQIVPELLSTSFYECPRVDPRRQVAAVNIAANYAAIYWRAPSIALQVFGALSRLFSSPNRGIESKKSAEWWNVINDEKREWTNSPNSHKSQTQQN